ncbi:TPA: DUF2213 domain-containing protein [Enterobacter ludwigii]|nr:DUF2213 domain-containing protein [Enterobacter ludwigii]HDR2600249.1 DUF2213 domain-containing protein [Enterobacter ludwigii]
MQYFFTTQLGETRFLQADGSVLFKDVPIARTGEQVYHKDDVDVGLETDAQGFVRILRTEEEVFSPATMASFEGVAVTLGHPEDENGEILFVNPSNYAELGHGHVQNVRRGEGELSDFMIADVMVKRQEALNAINMGRKEVSGGYTAKYRQTSPGNGEQYDITGNHLAVGLRTGEARGGRVCAFGDSIPATKGKKMKQTFLQRVVKAIRTKDSAGLDELANEAENLSLDDASGLPTININIPAQSPPAAEVIPPNPEKTTDEGEIPAWATEFMKNIMAEIAAIKGQKPEDQQGGNPTTDAEDEEEDERVTTDSIYRQGIIADGEIICPGFKPNGNKGLKRQILNHAIKTSDSLKVFKVQDFTTAPKATVDAAFTAAVEIGRVKNNILPRKTTDGRNERPTTIADLNKQNAEFWNNRK